MPDRMTLPQLRAFLEDHLLNFVMPFWLRHAIDPRGGICTCINDDGSINSYDKLMWSQLRAIWTFSALYNRIEKRQQPGACAGLLAPAVHGPPFMLNFMQCLLPFG